MFERIKDWILFLKYWILKEPIPLIRDSDGSLVWGRDRNCWVVFQIPLEAAFDLVAPKVGNQILEKHRRIAEALYRLEFQVDVTPMPITVRERIRRLLEAEDVTAAQRRDPKWRAKATRKHEKTAKKLAARKGGDWEPIGTLAVNLGRRTPAPSIDPDAFEALSPVKRFYTDHWEHYGLVEKAAAIMSRLTTAWRGTTPATRELVDKTLMVQMAPGQRDLEPPLTAEDRLEHREIFAAHYGKTDYTDCHPYHVRVDQNGHKSFVACLPINTRRGAMYVPGTGMENGLQAGAKGVRTRYTWRGSVNGGRSLLELARVKLRDVEGHAQHHGKAGGESSDFKSAIALAKAFYEHLFHHGKAAQGRGMLIATAETEDELRDIVANLEAAVTESESTLIRDNQIQRKLLLASVIAAKPYNRYIRTVGLKLWAMAMPYVTSAPNLKGTDLWGFVMGREILPVFYSLAAPFRLGSSVAPVYVLYGPSRRGKTSMLIELLVSLVRHGEFVAHLYDLAKFDVRLLDIKKLPPGVSVTMTDLIKYPGCLNPVLLMGGYTDDNHDREAFDELRISKMEEHLASMCGEHHFDSKWSPALRDACRAVLEEAYADAPEGTPEEAVIPNLKRVSTWLRMQKNPTDLQQSLQARLATVLSVPGAEISCSNAPVGDFLRRLTQPGMHIIQQTGLTVPSEDTEGKGLTPAHCVALATLDLATLLSDMIAEKTEIPTAIGYIEFNVISKISKGAKVAERRARRGGAQYTVTIYDTQWTKDLTVEVRNNVTGWLGATPNNADQVKEALTDMGQEITDTRVLSFEGLIDRDWRSDVPEDGITKGAFMVVTPTGDRRVFALLNDREYIEDAFLTDAAEQRAKAEAAQAEADKARALTNGHAHPELASATP